MTNDAVRERAAFDLWAKENGFGQSQPTTWCWEAWQARAALSQPSAPVERVSMSDEQIERVLEAFDVDLEAWKPLARAVIAEYERLSGITPAQGEHG